MICIDTKDGKPTNPVRTDSGHKAAHVFSDIPGPEGTKELLEWGRKLNLPPFWLQKEKTEYEHFDVWGAKLSRAVELADREVGMRGMVEILQDKRNSEEGYNNG